MVDSSQNASFSREKLQFFSRNSSSNPLDSFKDLDDRAQNMGYTFLLKNQKALETEFIEMFTILQKQDVKNKEAFWLYCYYCASLQEAFHLAYSQQAKADEFAYLKIQIKNRLEGKSEEKTESEEFFIASIKNKLIKSLKELAKSPWHLSQIRSNVAYANICRIYWVFCRLTLTQGLNLAKELKFIDKLDVILGTHTNVDKIISVFQAPTGVLNYFSVIFFLARFMIDGGLLLQHTFFPNKLEKGVNSGCDFHQMDKLPETASLDAYKNSYIMVMNKLNNETNKLYYISKNGLETCIIIRDATALTQELLKKCNKERSIRLTSEEVKSVITAHTGHIPEATDRWDRFKHELYKRHCNFANDLVWGTINFLTNFNQISRISGPVAGYLIGCFLVFDISMMFYKCNLAKNEYLVKKAQYTQELAGYMNSVLETNKSPDEKAFELAAIDMLTKQLGELEISWRTKEATLYFDAAAAALLLMGFTASLVVSAPALVGCYFLCQIAVAMYLTEGAYSQYKEKSLYLENHSLMNTNLPSAHDKYEIALKEYETARNDFIFTMIKNTVVPSVLIATFAICWPAAVILTVMYVGYEAIHAYNKYSNEKATKQLALAAPKEEVLRDPIPSGVFMN